MASVNRPLRAYTHGQSVAKVISPELMLRRAVLSCLLWEDQFYEDGRSIADHITTVAAACEPMVVYNTAMEARHIHGLRHVPLLLLIDLIKRKDSVIDGENRISVKHAIANVIRRPDEMMELLALYWKNKKAVGQYPQFGNKIPVKMSDRQLRDGLALAFCKFNEYSMAKYNRDGAVRLRDVMFLAHPKPKNEEQAQLFKRIANKQLKTPDTWEVELSAGKDKKETFERLIKEGKLGYLALLRNLRNIVNANCDLSLIKEAILARKGADLVFPFRYVSAARHAPRLEAEIDQAMQASIKEAKALSGTTLVLVDVSGSMRSTPVSARSDITRLDAAAALASVINAESLRVFSFANRVMELPARRGMSGIDSITRSQNGGTNLFAAVRECQKHKHDRIIVITDEQDTSRNNDTLPDPVCNKAYMINVASYRNGVGYGRWTHLDGFSEGVLKFIQLIEEFNEGK